MWLAMYVQEIEKRRMMLKERLRQKQQEQEVMDVGEEEVDEADKAEEEEESEYEEVEESDDEDAGPRLKPVFVRKLVLVLPTLIWQRYE